MYMSTTKKAVLTAVGFLIAIAFALLMFNLYKKGESSINSAVSQYDDIVDEYADIRLAAFDNKDVDGHGVIDAINKLDANSGYKIIVKNGETGSTGTGVTYDASTESARTALETQKQAMVSKTEANKLAYINPNASFRAELHRNANGDVDWVTFTQK